MEEKSICKLNINNLFDECVNEFDLDEVTARKAKNIKVLLIRGSKDNPHKAIMGVQTEKGVICKHIQEDFDNFKKNSADMSTAVPSTCLIWNVSYLIHIFLMIKTIFRLIVLICMVGFITISPRTRFIVGLSLKQISSFLFWTVKYEDREKWIIEKPRWIPIQIQNPQNK